MNCDMMKSARVCCEINGSVCDVTFPGFMNSVLKVFKPTIVPSEISSLSRYRKEYIEPAKKMHEAGNYSGAVEFYEKAVSAGSSLACFILSQYYLQGIGVGRDISRFFSLLEKGGVIRDDYIDVYRSIVSNGFFGDTSLDLNNNHSIPTMFVFLFHLFILSEQNRRFRSIFNIKSPYYQFINH